LSETLTLLQYLQARLEPAQVESMIILKLLINQTVVEVTGSNKHSSLLKTALIMTVGSFIAQALGELLSR
jgi:hypothetical protein